MKALGLVVSEQKIFYVFPIVCLWELMIAGVGPYFFFNLCAVYLDFPRYKHSSGPGFSRSVT